MSIIDCPFVLDFEQNSAESDEAATYCAWCLNPTDRDAFRCRCLSTFCSKACFAACLRISNHSHVCRKLDGSSHETTPPELLADSAAHVTLENYIAHLHTPPTGVRLVGDFEDDGAVVRSNKTIFGTGELVVGEDDRELAKAVIDQLLEHEGANIGAVGDVNVERLSHVVRLLRHNVDVLFALYWVDDGEMLMQNEFDVVFTDTSVGLDRTFTHASRMFNHVHPLFLPLVASALVLRRLGVRGKHDPPTETTFLTAMTARVPAMHLLLKRVPRGLCA